MNEVFDAPLKQKEVDAWRKRLEQRVPETRKV
jgi:hypothetical protein